jgi:uncharacterized protein (TIGR03435 family)
VVLRKLGLTAAKICVLAIPIVAGMTKASPIQKQSAVPKWEAVSVKRCQPDIAAGRRSESSETPSPDRLRLNCQSLKALMTWAYVSWANGHFNPFASVPLEGEPSWIDSEQYEINAKAEAPQNRQTLNGPMLRALLESRFKLKLHSETREIPLYALSVAKGGPKLQPFKEGTCISINFDDPPPPPLPLGTKELPQICGMARNAANGYDLNRATMQDFAVALSSHLDRKVVNRTGINGLFNIHLELTPADLGYPARESSTSRPDASDIFGLMQAAIGKLGLKLQSIKGPGEFLVIDGVERPTEN